MRPLSKLTSPCASPLGLTILILPEKGIPLVRKRTVSMPSINSVIKKASASATVPVQSGSLWAESASGDVSADESYSTSTGTSSGASETGVRELSFVSTPAEGGSFFGLSGGRDEFGKSGGAVEESSV